MVTLRACRMLAAMAAIAGAAPAMADPLRLPPSGGTAAVLTQIRAARLEPEKAVEVEGLSLSLLPASTGAGRASFEIRRGTIFPAAPVAGRVVEMVFAGEAVLVLEPGDSIEAGQLELHTGAPVLEEEVTEAVIVVTLEDAADALAGGAAAPPAPAEEARARRLFARWKERPERRLLGVETALLRNALGDPEGFFAGWFSSARLGEMLYLFEPGAQEQVSFGRFTAIDAGERKKRKLARQLHRQQRKGRLIGVALEDLGRWDTWLSASLTAGEAMAASRAFEPRHYRLEATLRGPRLALDGRARIHLTRLTAGHLVKLEIHPDLSLSRVALDGAELFFHQAAGEVLVVLPESSRDRDEVVLEVDYAGRVIERIDARTFALADTIHWYPHAGTVDLATYDVTLSWPEKLQLLAAGERIDGGRAGDGLRFERRRLERRSLAFGFEIGAFETLEARAGDVGVTLAVDALAASVLDRQSRRLLLAVTVDALRYFESIFGPYPLERLTVVTAARDYSQSLPGFITLSTLSMLDSDWMTLALGFEDRRTILAHEIAHQWWGHVAGWRSYRDQWISEAMANHAAVLYARHRLGEAFSQLLGPTSGWQETLARPTPDGRPLESLGPLVLGERLDSSRSADAYRAVVYQKGAIVLGMLSQTFGEQAFLGILRRILDAARDPAPVPLWPASQLSTESFIAAIERLSGHDLSAFAERFIYGTGLPEIDYDYVISPLGAGRWRLEGQARQRSPYRTRYRVVALRSGGFDVARERLDQIDVTGSTLRVPFELEVFGPGTSGRRSAAAVVGNLMLEGEITDFAFEVERQPRALWLDRGRQVFGRFFNRRRHPKRALYRQGQGQAAAGHAGAEDLLRRALQAEVVAGSGASDAPAESEVEAEGRLLDAGIELELARLYLDQGRLAEARGAFDRLRRLADDGVQLELGSELETVEARLAIRTGQPERAFRLLRKLAAAGEAGTESLLLLAIAARATGHRDQLEAALEAADRLGAGVAMLGGS